MKRKRLKGSNLRGELLKRGNELKTSKDKKKRKSDNRSSERPKTSSEGLTTSILKNKNLKSKEFKCKRLSMRLMMRSARFKDRSTTPPALGTKLTIDAKS